MGAIESCDDRELYDAPLIRSAVLVLLNFDWFMKSTTRQSLLVIGTYFSMEQRVKFDESFPTSNWWGGNDPETGLRLE